MIRPETSSLLRRSGLKRPSNQRSPGFVRNRLLNFPKHTEPAISSPHSKAASIQRGLARMANVSEDKKARLWDVPTISSKDSAEDVLRQFGRVAREPPGTRHRASETQSTGL